MSTRDRTGIAAGIAVVLMGCAGAGDGSSGFTGAASVGDGKDSSAVGNEGDGDGTVGANEGGDPDGGSDHGIDVDMDESTGGGDDDDDAGGEVCNGLDDNGNGMIDEGLGMLMCGVGGCENSVPACVGGVPNACMPLDPGNEVCNGVDDDCDGDVDEDSSAACDTACGSGTQACVAGVLGECDAPQPQAETCNFADDDCDGEADDGLSDGCFHQVHRAYNSGTGEHFYTTSLAEAMSPGFVVEIQNYFRVYAAEHPGLVPLNRCVTACGKHLYTTSATCEGTTFEGTLGWISPNDSAGTALYRAFNPSNCDHFYTTSVTEWNNATAGAYDAEGITGYVF